MQTLKIRSVLCLTSINNIIRSASSANAAAVKSEPLKPCTDIPGPSTLELFTRMFRVNSQSSILDLAKELYKDYGSIVRLNGSFGRPGAYMLFNPESAEQILRSEDSGMPIRPGFQSLDYYRNKKYGRDKPKGLVTDNGEMWRQFRTMVNPILLQPKTIKLYSDMLDEVADDMILRLKSLRGEDNRIQSNFDMEVNLWSLESIGLVALGRRLNCFRPDLPADSPEKRLIQLVHEMFKLSEQLDFKPSLWRYYATKTFKKAMKVYEEQANVAKYFVDKTIEELNKNKKEKSDSEKSVLEKLLEINKDVAVIMASDMLFAGVDTTANTMIAVLYLLAKNPDKQNKLREEVTSQGTRRPYMRACIKEAMRIHPVVAGNARETRKDHAVQGYHIPKGTQISFMHQLMSMMEENFPEPHEYIPERWMTSKDDPMHYMHTHPFVYSPFGFGVRSCIGRRIVELELELFLKKVIQNFKLEWQGDPMKFTSTSINYAGGPFNFIFKDV